MKDHQFLHKRRRFQCCCPRGNSPSSRILENHFTKPQPCPCIWLQSLENPRRRYCQLLEVLS